MPFQKRVKIPQKWYLSRKGSKIVNKKWNHFRKRSKIVIWYHFSQKKVKIPQQNGTISEKGQKSSAKMVPFQKMVKIQAEKGQAEKGQNSLTKMVPFQSEKVHNSSTKMVPFQKRVKIPLQNGFISEKGQKWYHFKQRRVKIPRQKWYHFSQKMVIIN